jgi:hypothetical protein
MEEIMERTALENNNQKAYNTRQLGMIFIFFFKIMKVSKQASVSTFNLWLNEISNFFQRNLINLNDFSYTLYQLFSSIFLNYRSEYYFELKNSSLFI